MRCAFCLMVAAACLATPTSSADSKELDDWLGDYRSQGGLESLRLTRDGDDALVVYLDRIRVPADGEWHQTVSEFDVRHRVVWIAESKHFVVQEVHDRGQPWRYEIQRDPESGDLLKFSSFEGERTLVRRFEKAVR